MVADFFNAKHLDATWAKFFVVSLLLPSGSRRTLARSPRLTDAEGRAKLYTKAGISGVDEDVRWVDFTTDAVAAVLRDTFGYKTDVALEGEAAKYEQQDV